MKKLERLSTSHAALAAALCLFSLINPRFAMAQTATATTSSGKASDPNIGGATEDIVVTAQKRSESAQKVGISITAFSAAQLQQLGVQQLTQVARISPGVSISGGAGGLKMSFAIRGVQQQDFAAIAEGPNAVYIDEGYVGIVNISGVGLFDVDNISVLKGPQGTLFGRNATGGVVNIATRNPGSVWNGFANASYGSHDSKRIEAAAGGPLSDKVSVRLAGIFNSNDNYIKNLDPVGEDLGRTKDWGVRGKLDFHPTENLSMLFTGFATGSHHSWAPYFRQNVIPIFGANGAVVDAVPTDANTGFGLNSNAKDLTITANAARSSGSFKKLQGGTFKASFQTESEWDFTAISDYKHHTSKIDIDNTITNASLLNTHDTDNFKSFSQELRAYKAWDGLRVTAGLYYLNMRHIYISDQDYRGAGQTDVVSDARLRTRAYAAFTQVEWDFAPKFTLIGGARYTRDEKKYSLLATNPFSVANRVVRVFPAGGGSTYLNGNLFTGKLALQYQAQPNMLFYASYNRGAKAGSFNSPVHANIPPTDQFLPYGPEYLDAYETGVKVDTLNGLARINASVFYYNYHNQQVQLFVLPLNSYILNLDNRTYGAEAELRLSPAAGLLLSASGAYLNALVKDVSLNGNPPGNYRPSVTPKFKTSLLARYEFPLFGGSFAVQGDAQYQSKSYFGLTNYTAEKIGGYWLTGGALSWTDASKQWSATLTGENILDKRYRTLGYDAATFRFAQYAVGQPRWVRFTLGYRF